MASINTPRGKYNYTPKMLYAGIKQIDRDVAFENLRIVIEVLKGAGITVSPACGTLLGIIRDNNFIEWDEDIDLFILQEDKDKLLNSLWDLREKGFELVRVYRCGHLYSIMRNGEYIDFYIMEKVSNEVRTNCGPDFVFEKYLTDLIDWNFRGLVLNVPREYEDCLEFLYGDWRTPVKWVDFELSKFAVFKMKVRLWLNNQVLPERLSFRLLKRHHLKDYEKFLSKCKNKGIQLKEEQFYFM